MMHNDIANLLQQRTGMDPESIGTAMIERAIRLRMSQCGVQQEQEYWERVSTSDDELHELIDTVIVPETWFFRDGEALATLAHVVVNEWLPVNPTGTLRVLSIPCSTGEEPYSIAMALLDAGVPPERFRVDAVDISRRALIHAKQAIYGKNSFRSQDLSFRPRYFDHKEDGYHLAGSVRDQVRFREANLLDLAPALGAKPYDAIFCRNLLIYFDATTQEAAVTRLENLLAVSGLLFVGPAEAFLMRRRQLTPIKRPRTFAFRKGNQSSELAWKQDSLLPTPRRKPAATGARPRAKAIVKPPVVQLPVEKPLAQEKEPGDSPDSLAATGLEAAGRLADAGRLTEAAAMCEAYLLHTGVSAPAYLLLGLTCDALGDQRRASECYRKVLYLEPGHREALAHLSLLLEKQGDVAGARRLQERGHRAEERAKA